MAVTAAGIACLPMCSYSKTQASVSLRWCTDLHSCTKTKTSSFVSFQRPHPKNLFCRVSWSSVTHSTKRLSSNFFSPIKAAAEPMEQTYVMVKPDGVQRGLVGEIISRFERKGFLLKGLKLYQCSKELAEEHYVELKTKPFFGKLIKYITSGPVVCMAWEGPGIVAAARKLIGVTNPLQAEPGTIRGDFAVHVGRNVVHGSDSKQSGDREIALWFKQDELCEWTQEIDPWLKE